MKIQLAYKFTGEDPIKTTNTLKKIKEILEQLDHEVYCLDLDPNKPNNKKEIYFGTLKKLDNQEILLALINSNEKSEGMLMEIGYAMAKNIKVICAIKNNITTHLRDLSDEVIEYEDLEDLYNKLKQYNFN